jgi:hypothetical protein
MKTAVIVVDSYTLYEQTDQSGDLWPQISTTSLTNAVKIIAQANQMLFMVMEKTGVAGQCLQKPGCEKAQQKPEVRLCGKSW